MAEQIWRVAVEAKLWMGPVSVTFNGIETTYPWKLQLVLQGEYPDDGLWQDPITDPLNLVVGKGMQLNKVTPEDAGTYKVCVQINPPASSQQPVLKEVATLVRY